MLSRKALTISVLAAAVGITTAVIAARLAPRRRRTLAGTTKPQIWVKTAGRPSRPTFHVHTDGREIVARRDELDALFTAKLPSGFKVGSSFDTHRNGASIKAGVPDYAEIAKDTLYVVNPRELSTYSVFGNELHPDHISSIQNAWRDGVRLDPIEIDVTANGDMYVEDGNHRLAVAARTNKPIAVRFRAVRDDYVPQRGARDIHARLSM